jgi:hypothetical protein
MFRDAVNPPVCKHVRNMCDLLTFQRPSEFFSYSAINISLFLGRCPVNINIRTPKKGPFRYAPKLEAL